jgi:hypothetical protein
MNAMRRLSYISDERLTQIVSKLLKKAKGRKKTVKKNLAKNVLDPFSMLFEMSLSNITMKQWVNREGIRQLQKNLQNAIGNFHEEILGAIDGWERIKLLDIRCPSLKIVAEIKNKFNTVKGSDQIAIYDSLAKSLKDPGNEGYTAYFVTVITKDKKPYNKPFTPPDHKTKEWRPLNEKIRMIDGKSFYDLATGVENALEKLFDILPTLIGEELGYPPKNLPNIKAYYRETFGEALASKAT